MISEIGSLIAVTLPHRVAKSCSSCAPPEVPVPSPEDLSKSASQQGSQEVGTAAQSNHSLTSSCDQPDPPVPPLKKTSNSASQLPVPSPGDEESREVGTAAQ